MTAYLLYLESSRKYPPTCVCGVYCMSAVQPQHPDEVSLIGSLWDSSAAFHSEPAHCQQSALTEPEPKTKDGTCTTSVSLSLSLYTHTQAYIQYTQTHNHQSAKRVCQLPQLCFRVLRMNQVVIIIVSCQDVYTLICLPK